jgi:hypothetical protein
MLLEELESALESKVVTPNANHLDENAHTKGAPSV